MMKGMTENKKPNTQGTAVPKKKRKVNRDARVAAVLLGPLLFWWIVMSGFPIGFGISLGFMNWRGVISAPTFAGLDNFIYFFRNPIYYESLFRAIWLGGVCMILTMVLSFIVALFLTKIPKLKGLFRTMWYVPAVTSVAAMGQIFLLLLDSENGAFNKLLESVGLGIINVDESLGAAIGVIIFYSVWKGIGGSMLLWIAGLQAIDRAQYEAASLDGAGAWQQFVHVTLPGLKPFITYAVITGAIGAVQIYEQVSFLTGGGPLGGTQTTVFLIMTDAFSDYDFGMAGASSLIMAVIVFIFAFFYLRRQRESVKSIMKKGKR